LIFFFLLEFDRDLKKLIVGLKGGGKGRDRLRRTAGIWEASPAPEKNVSRVLIRGKNRVTCLGVGKGNPKNAEGREFFTAWHISVI